MKNKYLVRGSDSTIWEVDESNGCYRLYQTTEIKNRPNAYSHFTFDILTKNYGWFPIDENEIPYYQNKCTMYYKWMNLKYKNDGHGGGYEDGTVPEFDTWFSSQTL